MIRLPLLCAALLLAAACARPAPPDLVLIVVDTLRADALGLYGSPRENAPRLAELARGGAVFERVVAPSSWTKTSMASLVTGVDPARHGVRGVQHVLPTERPTLAQVLNGAGYRTVGVQTNPWLHSRFGFDAGFESYEYSFFAPASDVNARARNLLAIGKDDPRPLFLYLHYMDVHAPYQPEPRWLDSEPPLDVPGHGPLPDAKLERLYRERELHGPQLDRRVRALYEAELRGLDETLGQLFDLLREEGRLERAVLVVTSDHGEAFGEHGQVTHGRTFYPEVFAVPLVVHAPGRVPAGVRIDARVRSIDVMPTLLALAGIALPAGVEGEPLLPMRPGAIRSRVARGAVGLNDQAPDRDWVAVIDADRLYLHERRSGRVELYDLAADPGALHDLGPSHPDAARLAALAEPGGATNTPASTELDEESRRQLEALGYLDHD